MLAIGYLKLQLEITVGKLYNKKLHAL